MTLVILCAWRDSTGCAWFFLISGMLPLLPVQATWKVNKGKHSFSSDVDFACDRKYQQAETPWAVTRRRNRSWELHAELSTIDQTWKSRNFKIIVSIRWLLNKRRTLRKSQIYDHFFFFVLNERWNKWRMSRAVDGDNWFYATVDGWRFESDASCAELGNRLKPRHKNNTGYRIIKRGLLTSLTFFI